MKQIDAITYESDPDKVFQNKESGERAWGVCLGVDDTIDNWLPEVPATEQELLER